MAFKILSEDQAALLTEKQRQQYEKELDIYEERKAFVERMHMLEDVEVPSYKPKLQNIAVIAGAPEKVIPRQEYAAKICAPAAKPELPLYTLDPVEPVKAVLPEGTRLMRDIPNISFAQPLSAEALLPEVMVSIAEVRTFCGLKELQEPQIELPTAANPHIDVEIKKVEPPQAALPAVIKMKPANRDFIKPEIQEAQLPTVSGAKFEFAGFETVELTGAALPTLIKAESLNVRFEEPKLSKPVCPRVPEAEQIKAEFKKAGVKISERKISGLPEILKPEVTVRAAAPVEHSPMNLPEVDRASAVDIRFKPPESPKPQIIPAQIMIAPITLAAVKPMSKAAYKAEGLPDKTPVRIPDPYEALRELIPEEAGL